MARFPPRVRSSSRSACPATKIILTIVERASTSNNLSTRSTEDIRASAVPGPLLVPKWDIDELVALYLAADVMLVTPLRDGMNLVAKEYVACRVDTTGRSC